MMELNELVNRKHLYHSDIEEYMEIYEDNEEVLQELRNFDADCKEAFEDSWMSGEVCFMNEDIFEDYAWELIEEFELVSEEMRCYIDIEKYMRDLKYDFYPVELDRKTFLGRY
jgi:hypothetical protein